MINYEIELSDYLKFLKKMTGIEAKLENDPPYAVISIHDFPSKSLVTLVTFGIHPYIYTMWRGKKSGFELTITIPEKNKEDFVKLIRDIVVSNIDIASHESRRPSVEYNGVYAPGYPPHFFFCEQLSQSPKLAGQLKVSNSYIRFLPAIPINDRELRLFDKSPTLLIEELSKHSDLIDWEKR
ncbi:suppressor of fused domain protein [Leptospira dzoumogneensis]|uniref:Suppressor of fused-like domain-containing protein n=1 Tax=Leptospira dzoumogneensis TaxID=2484904 RepID=A0A4Z1AD61_9LEPT|nr:suppressor of fused domain protein [Leptospira dzoumogneensis]TGN00044.1 hypothetical protein EHR06_07955 [Leptospira dzoumogneensis]